MPLYLDASAIMPLFIKDAHAEAIRSWRSFDTIIISDFGALEVAAVVSRALRTRRLDHSQAKFVLVDFDDWRQGTVMMRLAMPADVERADKLVRQFHLKLSGPDALHLAIAMAESAPLVTFDQRLADAARHMQHRVIIPST